MHLTNEVIFTWFLVIGILVISATIGAIVDLIYKSDDSINYTIKSDKEDN